MKRTLHTLTISALSALMLATGAPAQDFHGYDLTDIGPGSPSGAALRAMVAEAKDANPPRNGETYVFGYTMWGGSSPFSQLNRAGLEALAGEAGIELLVADNEWDPMRNVANAQSFATRNVDFVINSLLDIQFADAVKTPLDEKDIPLIALDIPVPGAYWVGVNNARAGFLAGTYLGKAAEARWGAQAEEATLVIAAFPLVGPNGRLRNMSEEAGVRSVLDLADDQVIWLDMEGTAESGYAQMNNLLGRLDPDKPLLIASFSDEQLAGALRAVDVADRSEQTIAVGMGGERLDALAANDPFIATVSFFPRRYANAALPAALAILAGREVPSSVFAYSALVTPASVCEVDPEQPCAALAEWQPEAVEIDEDALDAFVAGLYETDYFADFTMLLPPRE